MGPRQCSPEPPFYRARGCAPHEVFVTLYFGSSAPSHPTPQPAHKGVGALPVLLAGLPVGHVASMCRGRRACLRLLGPSPGAGAAESSNFSACPQT